MANRSRFSEIELVEYLDKQIRAFHFDNAQELIVT